MVTWDDGGDLSISGSETLTTPSGSQFAVTGGNGPYTWSVSGTGASVDQNGYLTLGGACGAYDITCTDCTGRSTTFSGRVTNNGKWTHIAGGEGYPYCSACDPWPCYCDPFCGSWTPCYSYETISGKSRLTWTQCTWCSVRGPGLAGCVDCLSHWQECAPTCLALPIAAIGYGWTGFRNGIEVPPGSGNPGMYFMDGPIARANLYTWTC